MTNVGFILNSSKIGGAEKTAIELAASLSDRFNITLFLLENRRELNIPESIEVVTLSNRKDINGFESLRICMSLLKFIRNRNIHILISNLNRSNYLNAFIKMFSRQSMRSVAVVHSVIPAPQVSMKNSLVFIKNSLTRIFYKHIVSKCDHVCFVSQAALDALAPCMPLAATKISIIPNGVNFAKVEGLSKEFAVRKDTYQIVMCARLAPVKNFPLAISAIEELQAKKNAVELVIIGPNESEEIYALIHHAIQSGLPIRFIGQKLNPYPYIAAADILLSTSSFESFGLVLVEASLCGTPFVTTNSGGPTELAGLKVKSCDGFSIHENGILVPQNDLSATVSAIEYIMQNPDESAKVTRNSRLNFNRFNTETISGTYASLIEGLIADE
ncbi:MAG: glycosyltransferase [Kordiimonadaceae bacterium]|nr:glycosyltransferase [Kordiimonadaceae bacterium]